jgi:hypothetical protein
MYATSLAGDAQGLRSASDELTGVELYWIPLGAGARFVRFNGRVYERLSALIGRRPVCDLYHTALAIDLPHGRYMVEMTPVPDGEGTQRGVVVEGPVGLRPLGALRLFRYEVRRWRDGVIPDVPYAVESPVRVTDDPGTTQRIFDLLPDVPPLVWGRDEQHTGDMWSCNSIISWTLTMAGINVEVLARPNHARAPGWEAGRVVATRSGTAASAEVAAA